MFSHKGGNLLDNLCAVLIHSLLNKLIIGLKLLYKPEKGNENFHGSFNFFFQITF